MTRFKKLIYILLLFSVCLSSDQLYLSKIVVGKGGENEAEKVEIFNPTSESINLSDYYIADFYEYSMCNPDGDPCEVQFRDFIAGFPSSQTIESNETITIGLHDEAMYQDYYGETTNKTLFLYDQMLSCSSDKSTALENPNLTIHMPNVDNDMLKRNGSFLLLKWDSNNSTFIEIDFLMWGNSTNNENPIRNYDEADPLIGNDSMYVRNDFNTQCDVSNVFCNWDIDTIFKWGCMDRDAKNYSLEAEKSIDCKYSIKHIHNNISDFLNTNVSLENVTVVDYFDITVYKGPYAITVEDEYSYRIELTVWPDLYVGGPPDLVWKNEKSYISKPPFGRYKIDVSGSLGQFNDKTQLTSIGENITVIDTLNTDGIFTASNNAQTSISPSPFVVIPSRGEVLQYSYSSPANSRAIVSIYDLSGRFVTTLFDRYHESPGSGDDHWNGRDHLGQILSPGTYIMQIETINSGKIETDFSPVVIGVQK